MFKITKNMQISNKFYKKLIKRIEHADKVYKGLRLKEKFLSTLSL